MAPQVKKAKTAFLYFQSDKLSLIRKELKLSMGDAMTEVRKKERKRRPADCWLSASLPYCNLQHDVFVFLFQTVVSSLENDE